MSGRADGVTCAVVIPCRNEAAHIGPLLDALAQQSVRPDEVIIVDDGSTDDTIDVVRAWTVRHQADAGAPLPVRVVPGPGHGPGPAMNAGISAAGAADIIIRFDGHSRPDSDYVRWSKAGVADARIGVVGGTWRIVAGAPTPAGRAIAAVVSHPLGSGGASYRQSGGPGSGLSSVETVPFGAFRTSLWGTLGGFDESLPVNEDFDFNYRTRKAGWDVVLDPRIQATYFARGTFSSLARQYVRYGYWKYQMLRKDVRALHWRQLPPMLVLPWTVATIGWSLMAPGAASSVAALAYPVALVVGSATIAMGRKVSLIHTLLALGIVHLAWSAGFWRAVVGRGRLR